MVCKKEMVFQQKLFGKSLFHFKMTGPAMVRPASCDFWKAPLDSQSKSNFDTKTGHTFNKTVASVQLGTS